MKKINNLLPAIFLLAGFGSLYAQKEVAIPVKKDTVKSKQIVAAKEEDNRNVMLNAANNTGPRDVNIGLPGSLGGITILENDLPVVYYFWPEFSNRTWRPSVSLKQTGLLKLNEVANVMGDLGFAVNSYTQTGTKKFQGKAKLTGNHYGWFQGDVNVSGPISKNGWAYTVGAFYNADPGTYDAKFTTYTDKAEIYRLGITKFFKNNKGSISALYKYANSYSINNFAVFEYAEGGEAKELDNFRIGRDSYLVRDGLLKLKDVLTGEFYTTKMNDRASTTSSHTFDIVGNYKLQSGWNLKYSARLHTAKASLSFAIPISIFNVKAANGYKYADGTPYSGNVGAMLIQQSPRTPTTTLMGNFSMNKKIGKHNLTFGLLEQYYHVKDYINNRSFFYQTVESNPVRLIAANTDADGFYNYNVGAEYNNGYENKIAVYGFDSWNVNDKLKLNYGLNLRYHKMKGDYYLTRRTPGIVFDPNQKTDFDNDFFHISGSLNTTYNLTKKFGLIGDFLVTQENGKLGDYSAAVEPLLKRSTSPLAAFGVFLNNKYLQLVSQATYVTKNNNQKRFNFVNPANQSQSQNETVYYDIQTMGWTTDILFKPFKGFNLHYLLTIQDPVYKKFNFNVFGKDYDYSDNSVLEISKVLMEIDPSYTFKKWKVWASFRYFSRQYGNLTNVLYFQPRWETFGGVNYAHNKNWNMGLTVVNFLNQRGAKGTINGSELITDPSPYYGKLLTGSYIMPFTLQLTTTISF